MVNFAAADFLATAGQTIQIPITAKLFGNYPLRVLMLNLSVVPLDGSPALTTPVSFSSNRGPGHALPDRSGSRATATICRRLAEQHHHRAFEQRHPSAR